MSYYYEETDAERRISELESELRSFKNEVEEELSGNKALIGMLLHTLSKSEITFENSFWSEIETYKETFLDKLLHKCQIYEIIPLQQELSQVNRQFREKTEAHRKAVAGLHHRHTVESERILKQVSKELEELKSSASSLEDEIALIWKKTREDYGY